MLFRSDYKPELERRDGQSTDLKFDTFFAQPGRLMKSPFAFRRHGQTGRWVSELLPHLSQRVDELARMLGGQGEAARKHAEALVAAK